MIFGKKRAVDKEARELERQVETALTGDMVVKDVLSLVLHVCLLLLRERNEQSTHVEK